MSDNNLVAKIDALLPQTQCEECGYKGCEPYAKALANNDADINLCVPGGTETLIPLAALLNKNAAPFIDEMKEKTRAPSLAVINEDDCIGCTKCIQACPVDAIIGSNKKMHSILEIECTGCGLCVEPCPVDCIEMQDIETARFDKDMARRRFKARNERLQVKRNKEAKSYQENKKELDVASSIHDKQSYILAALARVQNKVKDKDE